MNRRLLWLPFVFAAALCGQTPEAPHRPEFDLEPLRRLPVLAGGRFRPFDSYAREVVAAVTGEESPKRSTADGREARLDPVLAYCAWMFDAAAERRVAQLAAPDAETRRRLAPDRDAKATFFSYDDLAANAVFSGAVAAALAKPSETWTDFEREVAALRRRAGELAAAADGPPCAPPRGAREPGVEYRWGVIAELGAFGYAPVDVERVQNAWRSLGAAWRARDAAAFRAASVALDGGLRALGSPEDPAPGVLDREVRYHAAKPFDQAARLYFLAFWIALLAVVWRRGFVRVAATLVAVAGLGFHVYGSYERTALSGQALIGNLYESLLFVGGAAVLAALLLERRRRDGRILLAGALLGWIAVRAALDNPLFMPPAIARLRPVLINNFWIHIHVPAIMASYATLGLSAVLSHVWLLMRLFKREGDPGLKATADLSYRAVAPGVVLLFVGMILGGVWADASWGRFWGWDPKETWSFITWLVYLLIVHGRFTGKLRDAGLAFGGVVGGLSILMTYYGVNFFLSGLHSYAGAGGGAKALPTWLVGWLAFEVLLVAAAAVRLRGAPARTPGPAPERIAAAPLGPLAAVAAASHGERT